MADGTQNPGPIGSSMQDLVSTQKSGVNYLGQLIQAIKSAFVQFGGTATSATSGSASALPATPAGYTIITLPSGQVGKVPYYNL